VPNINWLWLLVGIAVGFLAAGFVAKRKVGA
jgi:hypothetical protein